MDIDRQPRVQGGAVDIGADESAGTTWNVPTPVVRVSPAGDDTDGSTWAKAKEDVTNGLALAAQTGGEVWVAQGTYPEHIRPPAFVYLYGGFAGNETNRSQRNPSAHATILDGGGVAPVVYYRNAGYRVSALDGFTVQGGGIYTGGNPFHHGPDQSLWRTRRRDLLPRQRTGDCQQPHPLQLPRQPVQFVRVVRRRASTAT